MAAELSPVVLVTGASRGIGRAAAQHLAARGFRVAVHYHQNADAAREVVAALPGTGHAVVAADVSDPVQCEALIAAVLQHFGELDVLVNNAGIFEEHDIRHVSAANWSRAWERTLAANLLGPAHLIFHAVQYMRPRRRGRVINVTSRGAFRGEPTAPAYGASKAALNSFGQSMARALAADSIYFYTLAPGWIDTDMAASSLTGPGAADVLAQHPLGRVGTPEEMGEVIGWLATDAPANMTGCIIDANGASYLRT